jgi:hypothetical protein
MRKSHIEIFFDNMNDKIFFVIILFIQLIFIFQGLDFVDSGFDADFYSLIFKDPSSVEYNFVYWFTGIVGGAWLKLFPALGLIGLRIAGVICTTTTCWITYKLLKRYLQAGPLRLSLIFILLFLASAVRELNYYDITALLFISAVWFLFNGLISERNNFFVISGAFIALNTFARIPNVMGLGLIIAIFFSGYLNNKRIKEVLSQSVLFCLGFVLASAILLSVMRLMHHDSIFIQSLKNARQFKNNNDNFFGIYAMIKLYFSHYIQSIGLAIVIMVASWCSTVAWRRLKKDFPGSKPYLPAIKYFILGILTVAIFFRAKKDSELWFMLFLFYTGICLIVGFLILTGKQPRNIRLLAAIGCLMILIIPMGSDFVLLVAGKYAVWIILPVSVDYILSIRSLSSSVTVTENNQHSYVQAIDVSQMTGLRNACIYLTFIFILSVTYYYPHFDKGSRAGMWYSVNNSHVKGVLTTKQRAVVVNELLAQSARYVKPNDYVLAYDCLPLYYYLTDTKPYMHNSWLWLYDPGAFKDQLEKSYQETHLCPVVILHKRSTLGNNWPQNYDEEFKGHDETLIYVRDFLTAHHYSQVWENDFFKIYLPGEKTTSLAGMSMR